MKLLLRYLFCLLTGTLLFSCGKDSSLEKLLIQSQDSLIMGRPEVALDLLGSIQNPERMGTDSYMQYISTYVGAKRETKADIAGDTLIFEAQNYFNDKGDFKMSALANYYAGWVYYTNNKLPQSLESFMHSVYAADKSNNYLLAAKGLNNIGYIYFEQGILDSAIINYEKALSYYERVENVDLQKITTLTNIGRSFEEINKPDSAYFYFERCLSLAKETENEIYQFYSLKNLGVVSYGMGEYDKAIDYFQSALSMNIPDEVNQSENPKIHLYLLNIFNKRGDLKLAGQYADMVTNSLTEVTTYNYTVKEIYAALSDYYKQTGDYKQALHYKDLEKMTKEQIEQGINVPALLEADKNFYLTQKDREAQALRSWICLILIVGTVVILILGIFVLLAWRNHRKDKAELRAYAEKYEILKGLLLSKCDEYPRIEAEIKAILEDD